MAAGDNVQGDGMLATGKDWKWREMVSKALCTEADKIVLSQGRIETEQGLLLETKGMV